VSTIGLLTTSFPRREGDLPGNFVLGFARALAARGHRLEVLCPEPSTGLRPAFEGIDVHWVRYAPRPLERTFYGAGVLDNLRREPLAALGLLPFVFALGRDARARAARWDAVVSHWALPCALIAGELRLPHLAVLHSADVFLLERLPARATFAERIATRADALLFSSRDLRRRFLALLEPVQRSELAQRAHVCPMGIEPALPSEARPALRARLGLVGPTLLSLSRLIPIKGLQHAIAALEGDWELAIAGDGPERATLERAARGKRVRFLGTLHGREKSDWLHAADAFVLPSVRLASGRTEGMPVALLEAMEHGLPVIASNTGGVADVVRDGENGLLVPPADASAIRAALGALKPGMAKAARRTAQLYHWAELAPMFETLLWPAAD
jgi:glycosyltransferase involved in cell wall biosynthesis